MSQPPAEPPSLASDPEFLWSRSVARSGVLILLPGLAGMALAAWLCWQAANTEPSLGRDVVFFIGGLVAILSALPLGLGTWLVRRPGPGAATVGFLLSGAYGLVFGVMALFAATGGPSRAIPFVLASMFLLATARLVLAAPWRFYRY